MTGSNLATGQFHVFSTDTVPRFQVADAVRISMSLPVIFKPIVIKTLADLASVYPSSALSGRPGDRQADRPVGVSVLEVSE